MSLLLALLLQDRVDQWIEELREGTIEQREAAELRLVEAGPEALPRLEPLADSADGELSTRVRRVIAAIRRNANWAGVLRATTRVTLEAKEEPFQDVMKRLRELTGFDVRIEEGVENRAISGSMKDVSYLEAVTTLCRAHGKARIEVHDDHYGTEMNRWRREAPWSRPMFRIVPGTSTREPVAFEGPFRLSLSEVHRTRSTRSSPWNFHLRFQVLWGPDVRVVGLENLYLDVLQDDQGHHYPVKRCSETGFTNTGPEPNIYDARFHAGLDDGAIDAARAFARVDGRVPVWIAASTQKVRVEAPEKHLADSYRIGDFRFGIRRCENKSDRCEIELTMATDSRNGGWWTSSSNPSPPVTTRFFNSSGRELYRSAGAGSWSIPLGKGETVAAVEIEAWAEYFRMEVPFRFKDVRLPQW